MPSNFYAIMYVESISLIILILFTIKVSSESHLVKCCPPGEILSSEQSKLNCTSIPNGAMRLYAIPENNTAESQRFPQCEKPENVMTTPLNHTEPDNFLKIPACLEILYNKTTRENIIMIVHCQSNKDRQEQTNEVSLPYLTNIRQCCPYGTVFEKSTKSCVPFNNSESFITFLGLNESHKDVKAVATEGSPRCYDGAIVDYEIDENDLFLQNNTYWVRIPPFKDTVNATEKFPLNKDNACVEMMSDSMYKRKLIARVCRDSEFCNENACIRKCCAENEIYKSHIGCELISPEEPIEFHQRFIDIINASNSSFDVTKDYGILIGIPCRYEMYLQDDENWLLTSKGYLYAKNYPSLEHNNYCLDIPYNKSQSFQDIYPFQCFEEQEEYYLLRYEIRTALLVISCIFLLMTLLVYACLPSLQNLHGKTVMCHIGSLLLAYTCLTIVSLNTPVSMKDGGDKDNESRNKTFCKFLGYAMSFSFLLSFSWLNIMCFDIWWTFGGLRGNMLVQERRHRRRFMRYCLYALGLAFTMQILIITADSTDFLPIYLQPDFGNSTCWFTDDPDNYSELIFFYVPITIQLLSNIVFFILTSIHCSKVKAELKRVSTGSSDLKFRNKQFHSDRNRYIMNMKLFVVMGLSWIFEILAYFLYRHSKSTYWKIAVFYPSDIFNALQGLTIFILFVLKSRVYTALRKRFKLDGNRQRHVYNVSMAVKDPYRVQKSASSGTITTSTFTINRIP